VTNNILILLILSNPKLVEATLISFLHARKSFDVVAEGLSRLNWLHRVDDFRNCFLYENMLETNPQFQAVELVIARM
jgi:hypothetical protein